METVTLMFNSVHVTLTRPEGGAPPLPTFVLFTSQLQASSTLLSRYIVQVSGHSQQDQVRLILALPDPGVRVGWVDLRRREASEYQARNRACGGVHVLVVQDTPGTQAQIPYLVRPFYADWMGALSEDQVTREAVHVAPVTGLGLYRSRMYRKRKQIRHALQALMDEVNLLLTNGEGAFGRHQAPLLHEAGLLAEALGNDEAWEYFETVALILYPNCHDALIGLALMMIGNLEQAAPLLARAYAIRTREDELKLFVDTFARQGQHRPEVVREVILAKVGDIDLDAPVYRDATGQALSVSPSEIVKHLKALVP